MRLARYVPTILALPLLALGAFAADPAPEEAPPAPKIYTCKDADGNTVYQDDPCSVVKPAVKKPPAQVPAKTQAPARSKSTTSPKPAAKSPAAPNPAPAPVPAAVKPPVATKSTSAKPRGVVLPSLKLPPPPAGNIDPRWATPEATLRTFIAAVSAGDRSLAVSCLTSYALGDLGPGPEAFPLEQLQGTVSSFTGYVNEGDLGPFWSIRALRDGQRPKWIFLERTGSGEWKIGGI